MYSMMFRVMSQPNIIHSMLIPFNWDLATSNGGIYE